MKALVIVGFSGKDGWNRPGDKIEVTKDELKTYLNIGCVEEIKIKKETKKKKT